METICIFFLKTNPVLRQNPEDLPGLKLEYGRRLIKIGGRGALFVKDKQMHGRILQKREGQQQDTSHNTLMCSHTYQMNIC